MSRRPIAVLALTVLAVSATAACDVQVGGEGLSLELASGRAQDTWTRSYTVERGGRLELINVNGQITAEPSDGATIELVGERSVRSTSDESARDVLGNLEIREEVGGQRVRVEVRSPRTFGVTQVTVRWTVKVPAGVDVDLRTVNGGVRINGLDGEVHARSVNGGIEGRRLAGIRLDASTVNGGVDLELLKPLPEDGDVSLEAVNGGVTLALPADSRASLTARVTNGGIRTGDLPFAARGENNRRRFEGTLNGGGASVRLQTTNGGVRVSKSG